MRTELFVLSHSFQMVTERTINVWAPLAITKDLSQIKRCLISIIIGPKFRGFRGFFMNGCEKTAESPKIHVEQMKLRQTKDVICIITFFCRDYK